MKRIIIILILMALSLPLLIMAQNAGGEIRRPVKTNTNSQNKPTNSNSANNKPVNENNGQPATPNLNPVLQNLINNMVRVEGGTFTMGATSEQGSDALDIFGGERPAHQVTLSSFSIGKYEVTQEEWEVVMGSNPSYFKGAKKPVERVSWDDCQEFIIKLNSLTGKSFRLPTEAEWEFAARGGNMSKGYMYAGGNTLDTIAWYKDNSGKTTHDVGLKTPNELGLYDMSGNVWEWCQDWFEHGYYSVSPNSNPKGPSSGSNRVRRGGSWVEESGFSKQHRVAYRLSESPAKRYGNHGFRLAL